MKNFRVTFQRYGGSVKIHLWVKAETKKEAVAKAMGENEELIDTVLQKEVPFLKSVIAQETIDASNLTLLEKGRKN